MPSGPEQQQAIIECIKWKQDSPQREGAKLGVFNIVSFQGKKVNLMKI